MVDDTLLEALRDSEPRLSDAVSVEVVVAERLLDFRRADNVTVGDKDSDMEAECLVSDST